MQSKGRHVPACHKAVLVLNLAVSSAQVRVNSRESWIAVDDKERADALMNEAEKRF